MEMEIGFDDALREGVAFDATVVQSSEIDEGFADRDLLRCALLSLPPREERVVRLYFGVGGIAPLTLREIGAEFGISGGRAEQLLQKGLYRVRHRFFRARLIKDRPERPHYLEEAARWREANRERLLARKHEKFEARFGRARAAGEAPRSAPDTQRERESERQAEYERQVRDARAMRAAQELAAKTVGPVKAEGALIDEGRWLRRVLRVFRVRDKVT
jgi:hypothetical protein